VGPPSRPHLPGESGQPNGKRHGRVTFMSDPADLSFRFQQLDHRLLSPKIETLAKQMHKRIADAEREIASEASRRNNVGYYLPKLIAVHEELSDEWAEKLYAAYCNAWREQNRQITPEFIRAIRDTTMLQFFGARNSAVTGQLDLHGIRTRQPLNTGVMGSWHRKMRRLLAKWRANLEAEAVALEYRAARQNVGSGMRVGRSPKRPPEFTTRAGKLWQQELISATGAKISNDQLKRIASELDRMNFSPPAVFLEKAYADQVLKFNSNHSNSKRGPIKSWSKLVEHADKEHVRGMRKLLSRCAKAT
jgi:hypothetical protein